MKSAKAYLIYLWFLGFLAVPIALVPPQVMNYLTSLFSRAASADLAPVLFVTLIYLLCLCGKQLIEMVQMVLNQKYLEGRIRRLSLQLYDKILRTSPDFFRNNETPAISNRIINDVRMVEDFLLYFKTSFPVLIGGLLVFSLVLFLGIPERDNYPLIGQFGQQGNWFLATLIILLSPLQAVFLLFDKQIQKIQRESADAQDKMASISQETIASVGEIRGHFAFDFALVRLREVCKRLNNVQIDMSKLRSVFVGGGPLMNAIATCILLGVGARLCVADLRLGTITVAKIGWSDFMGFSGMAVIFHEYAKQMVMLYLEWRITKENSRRVREYLNTPIIFKKSADAPPFPGNKEDVALENVHFDTKDGVRILNNINMRIIPGQHIAFVGPSGCGKSTALNLFVRNIDPTKGSVKAGSTTLTKYDFLSLARETSIVFQKPILLNLSLRQNLLLGLRRPPNDVSPSSEPDIENIAFDDYYGNDEIQANMIKAVEKVGLQEDVLRKALENPAPETFREGSEIFRKVEDLRRKITEKMSTLDPELICPFDRQQYLFEGKLRENILFGIIGEDRQGASLDNAIHTSTKEIFRLFKGSPLLEWLFHYGRYCFARDHSVAIRVKQHSSKLLEILKAYKSAADDAGNLAAQLGGISDKETESIGKLKEKDRMLLLEMALERTSREAAHYFEGQVDFTGLIVKSRILAAHDPVLKGMGFHHFDGDPPVEHLSVGENLIGGRVNSEIRGARDQVDSTVIDVMKEAGCIDELVLMGLEYSAGEGGSFLSGGQAMKVAIARSLLKNPSILLLDEATAPLDQRSQAAIMHMIKNEFRDRTVVFITHRISTVRDFDRIVVFDRGRIVQEGTYDELVSREGLFQTLMRQQEDTLLPAPKMTTMEKEVQDSQLSRDPSAQSSELQRIIALSPVFSNMTSEDIALLERLSRVVNCPKDTVLFNRGDEGEEFFIILDGEVEFFVEQVTEAGSKTEIVDIYGPGQSFGELALFGDASRTLGARAKTDLRLCTLNREDLIGLIEVSPQISIALLETLSKRIAQIRARIY